MKMEIVCNEERNMVGVSYELAKAPTEGKMFEVNMAKISKSLFRKRKNDWRQEKTRKCIIEAFKEVDMFPEKYGTVFYTYIPGKKWNIEKTMFEFEQYANALGGCMSNWVEQALEWAQRISNGETWEEVCNYIDTANFFRVIIGKNSSYVIVGGSRNAHYGCPASSIHDVSCENFMWHNMVVPLIRIDKK